jgi:hypothetical protein
METLGNYYWAGILFFSFYLHFIGYVFLPYVVILIRTGRGKFKHGAGY